MIERVVTGCLVGIVLFWCGASVFVRDSVVPDWWLPVALAAGLATSRFIAPRANAGAPARPWTCVVVSLLIASACAAVAYGSVATPSRHWDGAASFDAKVFWLVESPTLQQPFFAAAGVFHHSPDYPLLLPLLVAMLERLLPGCGRLVLPALYLLLCGVVAVSLRNRGVSPTLRAAVVLAVALTPFLISPNGGAVDSGYGELPMLLATTTIAGGLLTDRARFVALGAALAILAKPEGAAYAMLVPLVTFVHGKRRMLVAATAAIGCTWWSWAPVQSALLHEPPRSALVVIVIAAVVVLAAERLAQRAHLGVRGRAIAALAPPLALLACLPWLAPHFAEGRGALSVYLRRGESFVAGLGNVPAWLGAVVDHGVLGVRLGLTLVMPLACALVAWRRRVTLPERELPWFVALGLTVTALPFVLSPEADLGHHLRSSATRLLLHWVGPIWLLSANWLHALAHDPVDCARPAAASS